MKIKRIIDCRHQLYHHCPRYPHPELPLIEIDPRWKYIGGLGANIEFIKTHSHIGTHLDTPASHGRRQMS